MNIFYEGDAVRIVDPEYKLRKDLRGQTGVVVKWHHDEVYTVKLDVSGVDILVNGNEITKSKIPNPGSDEAVEQGCTCPVSDNHYGKGFPYGETSQAFYISTNCPLHGSEGAWGGK